MSPHLLRPRGGVVYCQVRKNNESKKWDVPLVEPATLELVKDLFHSIVKVKSTLAPMPRAWIPEGYRMIHTLFPYDGGINAYGTLGYCRAFSETVSGLYSSRVMARKTKISSLDVGDNELLAGLQAARLAEVIHA